MMVRQPLGWSRDLEDGQATLRMVRQPLGWLSSLMDGEETIWSGNLQDGQETSKMVSQPQGWLSMGIFRGVCLSSNPPSQSVPIIEAKDS